MAENTSRLDRAYRLFFQAVGAPGVDMITQAAYAMFGCPVLFTDEFFRVASMYPNRPTGIPEWDYAVEHKMLQQDKILSTMDEFLSGKKPFYDTFYANTGSCSAVPRIFGELVKDDAVYGHVIVFLGERALEPEDFKIIQIMLDAISIKIDARIRGMSRWNLAMTTKLLDLLTPNTPPHLQKLACEVLSDGITGDYAILATPIGPRASQKAFAEYAVAQLQQMYRNVISVIFDNVIVTLVGEVKSGDRHRSLRPETNHFVQTLFGFFQEHDMRSGLSNRFHDMGQLYIYYRQAVLTAKLAIEIDFQRPAVFQDFMPLPMFLAVLEKEDSDVFLHPALNEMLKFDQEHGTEYYETMRVFSFTMHNKDATAARLSIHRNTLLYRLNRITELFGLPYESEQTGLHLLCSYLLLECKLKGGTSKLAELIDSFVNENMG